MNKISGYCRVPLQRSLATIAPRQIPNEQSIAGIAEKTIGSKHRKSSEGKENSEKPVYGFRMPKEGEAYYDKWVEECLLFMEKVKNEKK